MVPCKSTGEEVSFEWSHHRISSTDSKVRTTLHVSIMDSGRERVNYFAYYILNSKLADYFHLGRKSLALLWGLLVWGTLEKQLLKRHRDLKRTSCITVALGKQTKTNV